MSPSTRGGGLRYRALLAVALFLFGCGSSEEITQTETHTIPAVTLRDSSEGNGYIFYGGSPCDTAWILHKYCRGFAQGEGYGLRYGVDFETRVDTIVQRDTLYVVRTVPVIRTEVTRDTLVVTDIDTVRVVQVEEYGFWDKAQLVLTTLGTIVLLAFLAWVASRFGLKLPF